MKEYTSLSELCTDSAAKYGKLNDMMETSRGFLRQSAESQSKEIPLSLSLLPLSLYPWRYRPIGSPSHCTPRNQPSPAFHPSHQTDTRFLTKRQIQKTERESSSEWVRRFTPL